MDSRERVRLALTCRQPDRVPKALGFFRQSLPAIAPAEPEEYFGLDVRFVHFEPPADQVSFLRYLARLPEDLYLGNLSQLKTYHRWGYHPERGRQAQSHEEEDVEGLVESMLPHLMDEAQYPDLAAQVDTWHRRGLAVAGGSPHLGGELFETAYRRRGFEDFLVDMVQRKEIAHYLLDQLISVLVHNALLLAKAGVDILLLDDDVASPTSLVMSLQTWREFFRPRMARVIQAARAVSPELLVFYHSDGNFTELVPDLIEIGVNVINPVQPDCMDAVALKWAFGDRLALWGTVGTARLWDWGTLEEVRQEVRERIATLGKGGGLLIAPAYDIDFAPFANIVAFLEAVERYG